MKKWLQPHLMALAFLGFNSGFAFILPNSTLTIALSYSGFVAKDFGILFWASLPYSLKVLWSPIMDHYALPGLSKLLGQRRSWILCSQIGLLLASLGFIMQPHNMYILFSIVVIFIFFAASQDIALDAYRIERLANQDLANGTTFSVTGFRIGTLIGGVLPLYLLKKYGWEYAFLPVPCLLLLGPIVILLVKEPSKIINAKSQLPSFTGHLFTVFQSLLDFLKRPNWYIIVLFIFFYKISESIPHAMRGPLLAYLKFTPVETANISQAYGIGLMIIGGFLGGILSNKFGLLRGLMLSSCLQLLSPISCIVLSMLGHSIPMLLTSATIHGLASGASSTLLIIYISSLCSKNGNTGTEYSLIYSFGSLARVILSGGAAMLTAYVSWTMFFTIITILSLPVFLMIYKLHLNPNKLIHK